MQTIFIACSPIYVSTTLDTRAVGQEAASTPHLCDTWICSSNKLTDLHLVQLSLTCITTVILNNCHTYEGLVDVTECTSRMLEGPGSLVIL